MTKVAQVLFPPSLLRHHNVFYTYHLNSGICTEIRLGTQMTSEASSNDFRLLKITLEMDPGDQI